MLSNNNDTPPNTTERGDQGNNRSNSNSRGNNNNRNRNNGVQSTESINFEGSCPEIGAVATLQTEKINKKVTFAIFAEKVADYIITNYKYSSDVERTIRELTDPFSVFASLHRLTLLTDPAVVRGLEGETVILKSTI